MTNDFFEQHYYLYDNFSYPSTYCHLICKAHVKSIFKMFIYTENLFLFIINNMSHQ